MSALRAFPVLLGLAAAAGPALAQADRGALPSYELRYEAEFAGWDSGERVNVWTGRVSGATAAHLHLRAALQLPDERANERVWPLRVRWIVMGAPHSFEAELYGSADWRSGRLALQGRVLRGWCQGCSIVVEGRHPDSDGVGSVVLTPAASVALDRTSR